MDDKLLIISGPTAAGKTDLSIELARSLDAEIINADSMQVYRYMNIGTAKITSEEMSYIPHHLFDIADPTDSFDVVTYKELAIKTIKDIHSRGKLPMLVGGTGFYIQAVLYDIDFGSDEPDIIYREKLENIAYEKGSIYLHDMLKDIDIDAAAEIHPNNVKRVIRALEYHHTTGGKISEHNRIQRLKKSPYSFHYCVYTLDRDILYDRIDTRVDMMLSNGLIDEVKALIDMGVKRDMTSMQGLGYKEIYDYLMGEYDYDEAVYRLKRDTRHFAKRQLTWFKREKDVTWYTDKNTLIKSVMDIFG